MDIADLYAALGKDISALLAHPELPEKSFQVLSQFVNEIQAQLKSDEADQFHVRIAEATIFHALTLMHGSNGSL